MTKVDDSFPHEMYKFLHQPIRVEDQARGNKFLERFTFGPQILFESADDSSPLLSRCQRLSLCRRGLAEPFAERCRQIAQAEGLDGQPIESYVRLMKQCRNNLRMAIQMIETGEMMSD